MIFLFLEARVSNRCREWIVNKLEIEKSNFVCISMAFFFVDFYSRPCIINVIAVTMGRRPARSLTRCYCRFLTESPIAIIEDKKETVLMDEKSMKWVKKLI